MPPLLQLASEAEYRQHFAVTCCQAVMTTHDGIRVYFRKQDFDHAFFESSAMNGVKDQFSRTRAERMDWIAATLSDPTAVRFQGWHSKNRKYDPTRCVSVVHGDFVVVLSLSKKADGTLKANFVTCYDANNSIGKIRRSPLWNKQDCLNAL
jgi:hypothetical protein